MQKYTRLKGKKTVPDTVSKYKLFTFSFFDGVLLSRNQLRNIHRKSLFPLQGKLFHQPRSNRGRISGLLPYRCASLFLLFFSFFLSFHFFKSTFPVSFCFKMLLLQQFLLKHCCCRMYSLSMGKVLSLHIKIQGLPWTLGNQVGFKVHSCVQNTRIVQQNSERDWAQFHPLCYCLCPAPLLFHRHPTADW